jgi:hypothetical protein
MIFTINVKADQTYVRVVSFGLRAARNITGKIRGIVEEFVHYPLAFLSLFITKNRK